MFTDGEKWRWRLRPESADSLRAEASQIGSIGKHKSVYQT